MSGPRILVKRRGALGDVIISTPIVARLRREYPDAFIDIQTSNEAVYQGQNWKNPHINGVSQIALNQYDKIIDLDMAHETRRRMHQIDAYMEAAFGDRGECDGKTYSKQAHFPIGEPPRSLGNLDWSKVVTIHPNTSWQNRTVPIDLWQKVADHLIESGYTVIVLGTRIDKPITQVGNRIIDTRDRLNLYEQAAVIAASRTFVCGGSGLFMLAGTTETPIVVFLTISRAEHCLPFRHEEMGWNCYPIVTSVPCYGCNENQAAVTFVGCDRGDYGCISSFSADMVMSKIEESLINDKRNHA
ncbi:MAG: glycosyltransferase family 9 protein [Patescibacteria group bacterium]|nr:glycosyltransferase family 9 protein [Patescibacteria group bacterium]